MTKRKGRRLTKGQRQARRGTGKPATPSTPRRKALGVWIGLAAIALVIVAMWRINVSRDKPAEPSGQAARGTAPPQTDAVRSSNLEKLIGRWVRTDAPYVIEIRSAGDGGALQAAYYNPRPITVSRAEVRDKNGELEVFVELRDVNYPGSTYTLTYDRAKNRLQGTYFQAAMKQYFAVNFVRARETDGPG